MMMYTYGRSPYVSLEGGTHTVSQLGEEVNPLSKVCGQSSARGEGKNGKCG